MGKLRQNKFSRKIDNKQPILKKITRFYKKKSEFKKWIKKIKSD